MSVLVLEDKLGITDGYKPAWTSMLLKARMNPGAFIYRSVWRDPRLVKHRAKLLIHKGNRKSPGFNPEVQSTLRTWFKLILHDTKPQLIICMDVALLGLVEPEWANATIDNLRGGVYRLAGIPVLIMTPVSAINTQKKLKDIQALNEGAGSKEEFLAKQVEPGDDDDDESDRDGLDDREEKFFIEPYVIPYGHIILRFDLAKARRLYEQETQIEGNP